MCVCVFGEHNASGDHQFTATGSRKSEQSKDKSEVTRKLHSVLKNKEETVRRVHLNSSKPNITSADLQRS